MELNFVHPNTWPRDSAQCVFFGRAVIELGRARFGTAWTGTEPTMQLPVLIENEVQKKYAYRLVNDEAKQAAISRYFQLSQDVVSLCESGILETVLRPRLGGEVAEIPCSHWNTEDYLDRFVQFTMHPEDPFWSNGPEGEVQWIFVTKKSLKVAVATLRADNGNSPVNTDQIEYSPYLSHMIAVSQHMKPSPQDTRKIDEFKDTIRAMWKGDGELTPTKIDSMATFIRYPEAEAGGGRKRK
jgi:hypothetical protein